MEELIREDSKSTTNLVKVVEALCLILTNCIDVDSVPFRCDRRCPQKKDYYKQLYPDCPLDIIYDFQREMKKNE